MKIFIVGDIGALHLFVSGLVLSCFPPQQTESEQAASHSPNL